MATAASGAPKASATATPQAGIDPDAPIKYARCMRENGMTWFPDPQNGRTAVRVPSNVDPEKMKAAEQACRQYAPNGGERAQMNPEDLEQVRQMARCMRETGVPNFPDPKPDGSLEINGDLLGTGPGEPTFDKAEQLCSKYRPSGAAERHVQKNGPGEVAAA